MNIYLLAGCGSEASLIAQWMIDIGKIDSLLSYGAEDHIWIGALRHKGAPEPKLHPALQALMQQYSERVRYVGDLWTALNSEKVLEKLSKETCVTMTRAIGRNALWRLARKMAEFHGIPYHTFIHPAAYVDPSAHVLINNGSVIHPGVHIGARANIHCGALVNTHAIVEHDCTVGENAFIGPGTILCGSVTVGKDVFIGAGSKVAPAFSIGERAFIQMGSNVCHDGQDGVTMQNFRSRPRHYKYEEVTDTEE